MYKVEFINRFVRSYKNLDKKSSALVEKAISLLVNNPHHPSLRMKRIQGTKNIWEASAGMSVRITFMISEDVIQLRNVGTHDQIFRSPY
jgi:mRNA-degrading endonuclease YafQ of YafQ-DinJ toxin-antitoxin module